MTHILYKRVLYVLLGLTLAMAWAQAQEMRVIPELERNEILIGEQVQLRVRVVHPASLPARLVLPNDTLVTGVHILGVEQIDSVAVNNHIRETIYSAVLTSFDSARYTLQHIRALIGDSLIEATVPSPLFVNTVPVQVDKPDEYHDIKDVWTPDFVWRDYLNIILAVLGLLLLSIVGIYGWRRWRKYKAKRVEAVIVPPADPYKEAMEALSQLKQQMPHAEVEVKGYYTALTEILRRYIYRTMGIHTADKTSSEILDAFRDQVNKGAMYDELKRILSMADLAKFAKYIPASHDNMALLNATEAFVEEYKPTDTDEEAAETLS